MCDDAERPAQRKRRVRDEYLSLDGSPDEESGKDPIPRIRTYQWLLLEAITPEEQLEALSTLELRELAMRLECDLYQRLRETADSEQDLERYESRIKFLLDILTTLAEKRDEGFERGFAEGFEQGLEEVRAARRAESMS